MSKQVHFKSLLPISATVGLCITSIRRKLFPQMHLKAHKQTQDCKNGIVDL